jgi:hypothetical protein
MEFTNIEELFADCCLAIKSVKCCLDDLDLDISEFKRQMNVYFMITLDLLQTELLKMSNYGKWCDSILKHYQRKQMKDIDWKKGPDVISIGEMIGIYHYLIEDEDCAMKISNHWVNLKIGVSVILYRCGRLMLMLFMFLLSVSVKLIWTILMFILSKCVQLIRIILASIIHKCTQEVRTNKMPVAKFTTSQIAKLHRFTLLPITSWPSFESLPEGLIQEVVGIAELDFEVDAACTIYMNVYLVIIINNECYGMRINKYHLTDLSIKWDKVAEFWSTPYIPRKYNPINPAASADIIEYRQWPHLQRSLWATMGLFVQSSQYPFSRPGPGFEIHRSFDHGDKFEIEKEPFARYDPETRKIVKIVR